MGFQYSDCSCYRSSKIDLVAVDKKRRTCKTFDFAVPGDSRIEEKEKEKIEKYQHLRRDLQKCQCESKDYTISYGLFSCYT